MVGRFGTAGKVAGVTAVGFSVYNVPGQKISLRLLNRWRGTIGNYCRGVKLGLRQEQLLGFGLEEPGTAIGGFVGGIGGGVIGAFSGSWLSEKTVETVTEKKE